MLIWPAYGGSQDTCEGLCYENITKKIALSLAGKDIVLFGGLKNDRFKFHSLYKKIVLLDNFWSKSQHIFHLFPWSFCFPLPKFCCYPISTSWKGCHSVWMSDYSSSFCMLIVSYFTLCIRVLYVSYFSLCKEYLIFHLDGLRDQLLA